MHTGTVPRVLQQVAAGEIRNLRIPPSELSFLLPLLPVYMHSVLIDNFSPR